jgi:predicted PurR-regulated permease PerM
MAATARRAAICTIVVIAIIAATRALWQLRLLLALIFLGFILAAAMRPGVEWLAGHGVPRPGGVALHYVVVVGLVAGFLWLIVPRAVTQLTQAIGGSVPTKASDLNQVTKHSTGFKHELLVGLQKRLQKLPSGTGLIHPAITVTKTAFEILIGIVFTLATAAYWIFERDRAISLLTSLFPRPRRKVIRDTWLLIDLKLGAFVRGQLLLIGFVAALLSTAFWAIGLPYWILIGFTAGVVELVPVIGPVAAGALAIAVGFTQSWHLALLAGLCVLAVRLLEDYVVVPRVLGHAVGLSPLVVLFSVTSIGLLLGGVFVLLAIPVAAVFATLVDVIIRDVDPAAETVPTVLFTAQDAELT